uniref:General transcription factor IIE subunit 1 n=1 Tax=Phallusia mammillata TaxID=59560 RepID=A0A6F9DF11_9ASCI|nr:general transcription factor IIE subunit 1-like [Phallusia mammillata]
MDEDPDVLREVPDALQRLVRCTVRGFYGIEHALTVDVLVRNACVKEEDIQELLKFDKKQLRTVINQLKNDKFLKSRAYVETQDDGKVTRHYYYYINYRSIANVIKYKLHHMHKRIETMERDTTNRPSFKCPTCLNTYSDLEVNQLVDPMFGTLNCTFCKTEVLEDKEAHQEQDLRVSQAKFNEQMEPVYKLLREVENITLSEDVLEPKPTHIPHLHPNGPRSSKGQKHKDMEHWSTGKTTVDFGHEQAVVIDMGEKKVEHVAKEVPQWMIESTVTSSAMSSKDDVMKPKKPDASDQKLNDEVMQTLLVQEGSSQPSRHPHRPHPTHGGAESEESDEFEDVDDETMVTVAGQPYTYEEVESRGNELISLMTSQEKQEYIEIGQKRYEDMHD